MPHTLRLWRTRSRIPIRKRADQRFGNWASSAIPARSPVKPRFAPSRCCYLGGYLGPRPPTTWRRLRRLRPERILARALDDSNTLGRTLTLLTAKGDPRRTGIVARSLLPKSAEDLSRMRSGHVYDPDKVLVAIHTLQVVQDPEAVPALGALFGSDQTLSLYVARALVAIGHDDAEAGRVLVRAMDSRHSTARIHAAEA
jgi:hypothetical protein